ncbi:MAG: M20/M25/M40 family metallo-hydrolase [Deltaproteobacteria bacterium]|nr:MAG: M20/M25/M40 family metallo-hydrolase [Deltaproteobacteria bacterium]
MIKQDRLTDYTMDLITIDSPSKQEKEVAMKLKYDMEQIGAQCSFDSADEKVGGNVGNLTVKVKGNTDAPPFFFSSHMDTVSPGIGIKPHIKEGIMRSDGTTILGSDDKSGIAIIVEVIKSLKENNIPHGDIEVAFTICEEIGLLGAKYYDINNISAKHGIVLDSSTPDRLVLRCPSAEELNFTVHGIEAHAGLCPQDGISAIKVASDAISTMTFGRIDHETTSNIGIIKGGIATNIVTGKVEVVGEVRSHDEQKLKSQVYHMTECFMNSAKKYKIVLDGKQLEAKVEVRTERSYDRMDVGDDSFITKLVLKAVQNLRHKVKLHTTGGGCDANYFNKFGLSCANLGTGMYELHTVNEYLVLEEQQRCAKIMLETVKLNAVN